MKILSLKHARAAAVAVCLAAYGLVPDAAGLAQALSFTKAKNYTVGTNPVFVVTGDFNNDSKVDLAVVNAFNTAKKNNNGQVSILFGNGDGTFSPCSPVPCTSPPVIFDVGVHPVSIAVGDFNEDGNLDLAVANFGDPKAKTPIPGNVTILLGDGAGSFTAGSPITVGTGPIFIAVGNFNPSDTHLDLAVANFGDTKVKPPVPGNVSILMGNGDGTFSEAAGSPITVGIQPVSIAVGNFNSDIDLIPDLAVANFVDNTVSILLGIGDGTFAAPTDCDTTTPVTPPSPTCLVGTEPVSIVTGDFNKDGVDDLAVANESTTNASILLGNPDTTNGLFQAAQNFNLGKIPVSLTAADFNGDGALDLVAARSPGKLLSVILGNGEGTFAAAKTFSTVAGQFAIATDDFNGDGKPDLAVVNGKISVLLNTTLFPGAAPSIAVTAPNGGESLTIGATTNITWTSNDIPGSKVRIDLTRDSTLTPIVWKTIVKSAKVEDGTKAWKVTGPAATNAQIRICSIEYPAFCDTSNADFTIN